MIESIVEIENELQIVIIDKETGERSIITILGSTDLCQKYYIYEIELDRVAIKLGDEGIIIENHPDFIRLINEIKSHRNVCQNPIHDGGDEISMYLPISLNIFEESSLFTLNLKVETILPPYDVMELKSRNVIKLEINELISFIVEVLSDKESGDFHSIIEDEFGVSVLNYTEKEKSKNQSIFIEVAGDVEDLVYDKLGENSKEYLSLRKVLEPWE